ncbi:MAG: hypothetical protein K9G43_10025 [Rhodobacteraceae bacterium]|nr:hypothetical protein [Paracoccaceae bacterium]
MTKPLAPRRQPGILDVRLLRGWQAERVQPIMMSDISDANQVHTLNCKLQKGLT